MEDQLYGGIEAGGTKFICAVGNSAGEITARVEIATGSVNETMEAVCNFFKQNPEIAALGVGSFGPVNLNPSAAQFGYITQTPKPGWQNTNIKGILENDLKVPVIIDTDVNCAALGEKFFGLAKQIDNFVYLTVGTGIGGSLLVDGKPYHGESHLEIGHMKIPHEPFDDGFEGGCQFHKDCLEGIASGRAMELRWGKKPEEITDKEPWELEAKYLAEAISNLILTFEPKLFILGGGVMKHPELLEAIHRYVRLNIDVYVELPPLGSYIVSSNNPDNGVLGAIKLASVTQ